MRYERSGPTAISAIKGVIVSDDMEMGAVREHYALEERVVRALNAGVDLLVFSNVKSRDTELGVKLHEMIAKAVRDGAHPARSRSRRPMSGSPRSSAA